MVRTTLGAEVDTTVTVSGSESVEFLNLDITGSVSTGVTVTKTVRPPAGFVYEVLGLRFSASNPGGTSGNFHDIVISSEKESIELLIARSSGDQNIVYIYNHINTADKIEKPPSAIAQLQAIRGIRASETAGIDIRYRNQSGATQTSTVLIQLAVRQIQVSDV